MDGGFLGHACWPHGLRAPLATLVAGMQSTPAACSRATQLALQAPPLPCFGQTGMVGPYRRARSPSQADLHLPTHIKIPRCRLRTVQRAKTSTGSWQTPSPAQSARERGGRPASLAQHLISHRCTQPRIRPCSLQRLAPLSKLCEVLACLFATRHAGLFALHIAAFPQVCPLPTPTPTPTPNPTPPLLRRPIEKNQGCMHMTCSQCRHEFCWLCQGPWAEHGERTGGFYNCNRWAGCPLGATALMAVL